MFVRQYKSHRGAQIGVLGYLRHERQAESILSNSKYYIDAELFHDQLGVTLPEHKVLVSAFGTLVVSHVLHDPQNTHAQFLEHFDSLDHVHECQTLRGGHNQSPVEFQLLAQTDLDVSRSRGHIHHQVVQLSPLGLMQQL